MNGILKVADLTEANANPVDGKHYWLTPPALCTALDEEFHFDFDPCPYPRPESFDGLTCEWGNSNYVNPPFAAIPGPDGKKRGITAWVRKAIEEQKKGKDVVLVAPQNHWVSLLAEAGAEIRNLGEVKWVAVEDGATRSGGWDIVAFILKGKKANQTQ